MASDQSFIDYLSEQADQAGRLSHRKMFGEYALYLDGKVVAFVCDNHLFVKPTDAGRRAIGQVTEAPPYPGAKPYFLIGDELDDRELLCRILRATADALPMPAPKKPKAAPSRPRKKAG